MPFNGRALVYGCNGFLGQSITKKFMNSNWQVFGCDLQMSYLPHSHLLIPKGLHISEQEEFVNSFLKSEIAEGDSLLDAIICTSGGFNGGNIKDLDFISKSYQMISSTVFPSLICSKMASKYLKKSGLLILPGAAPGLEPCPSILSYSAPKAYVHYLVKSLSYADSGVPEDSKVVGLAPVTLDTPINRLAMPDQDFSNFTPLEFISDEVLKWSNNTNMLNSGSILKFITKNGKTTTHTY